MICNCEGLKSKQSELNVRLEENEVDIGIITETKLIEKDKLRISGYITVRKERVMGKGREGGIVTLIKK